MGTWSRRYRASIGLAVTAASVLGPRAEAGTATGAFAVQTQILVDCTFTTNALSFNYPSGSKYAVRTTTAFIINCPAASPAFPQSVYFTFTPTGGAYQLKHGDSVINYELCFDPSCLSPYPPNGSPGAGTTISLTRSPYTYVLYGQIPAGQAPSAGNYSQTVTASLNF